MVRIKTCFICCNLYHQHFYPESQSMRFFKITTLVAPMAEIQMNQSLGVLIGLKAYFKSNKVILLQNTTIEKVIITLLSLQCFYNCLFTKGYRCCCIKQHSKHTSIQHQYCTRQYSFQQYTITKKQACHLNVF